MLIYSLLTEPDSGVRGRGGEDRSTHLKLGNVLHHHSAEVQKTKKQCSFVKHLSLSLSPSSQSFSVIYISDDP